MTKSELDDPANASSNEIQSRQPAPSVPSEDRKDAWDKLAAVTTLISSVVIGGAGVAATYIFNTHELEIKHIEKEIDDKRLTNQSDISNQMEINKRLESLFKYVSSEKINEREFGYAMFQALGQEGLAIKLISINKDQAGLAVSLNATSSTDPLIAAQARRTSDSLRINHWLFPDGIKVDQFRQTQLVDWMNSNSNSAIHNIPFIILITASSLEKVRQSAIEDLNIP